MEQSSIVTLSTCPPSCLQVLHSILQVNLQEILNEAWDLQRSLQLTSLITLPTGWQGRRSGANIIYCKHCFGRPRFVLGLYICPGISRVAALGFPQFLISDHLFN